MRCLQYWTISPSLVSLWASCCSIYIYWLLTFLKTILKQFHENIRYIYIYLFMYLLNKIDGLLSWRLPVALWSLIRHPTIEKAAWVVMIHWGRCDKMTRAHLTYDDQLFLWLIKSRMGNYGLLIWFVNDYDLDEYEGESSPNSLISANFSFLSFYHSSFSQMWKTHHECRSCSYGNVSFLLGGGGASLAGPQREQQHSHVGPLPCGVFAGQAPLILVDSILILVVVLGLVYVQYIYQCTIVVYVHIYIYIYTHIPVQVHIPFSTGCWAIFYGFFAYPNAKPGEHCLALPPIGTIGVVIIYYYFVSMAISGTDVLEVPSICLRTIC